jgi:hypothetical protein
MPYESVVHGILAEEEAPLVVVNNQRNLRAPFMLNASCLWGGGVEVCRGEGAESRVWRGESSLPLVVLNNQACVSV